MTTREAIDAIAGLAVEDVRIDGEPGSVAAYREGLMAWWRRKAREALGVGE